MKRRAFLRTGAYLLSGLVWGDRMIDSDWADAQQFDSLDVLTDRPDLALRKIEALFPTLKLGSDLHLAEQRLSGRHMGDLAFVRGQHLIDYRRGVDAWSRGLARLARELELPRPVDNPVRIGLYRARSQSPPQALNILEGNRVMHQLSLDEDMDGFKVAGTYGAIRVTVHRRRVAITAASCTHKTCMKMGEITQPGQKLVCIPSRMMVAIPAHGGAPIDGLAG